MLIIKVSNINSDSINSITKFISARGFYCSITEKTFMDFTDMGNKIFSLSLLLIFNILAIYK